MPTCDSYKCCVVALLRMSLVKRKTVGELKVSQNRSHFLLFSSLGHPHLIWSQRARVLVIEVKKIMDRLPLPMERWVRSDGDSLASKLAGCPHHSCPTPLVSSLSMIFLNILRSRTPTSQYVSVDYQWVIELFHKGDENRKNVPIFSKLFPFSPKSFPNVWKSWIWFLFILSLHRNQSTVDVRTFPSTAY